VVKIEDNDYKGFDDGGSWVPALVIGLLLLFICGKYLLWLVLAATM